ncbi:MULTISPECIES: S-layer homology domain-containing protein [unclassified Paenibacillus]|uniref:S-layer homology domain-containing protein n=1 Tax=unclassified Paenibacillus TaxID=185978 RepID=UPI0009A5CA9D|nr:MULTISPECIES: S-layer homology domain-containing protein [unclassified Paenibacillus]SLK07736.1 S-layer homology domain-containing protein [Paenibacillus sp. RU5A]SOC70826.1 S-layer homology domain-containing protein [Paenibacillus sp. RU26A]SOC73220.1 S-layer homology domain-containing protein [Paenibacillus sp. RU5M]
MRKKDHQKRARLLRRIGVVILSFLMVFGMLPVVFQQGVVQAKSCYEITETDSDDVEWKLISTPEELYCVREDLNGNYKLKNDISEAAMSTFLNRGSWTPIADMIEDELMPFTGRFDGNGYSISGLKTMDENQKYVGLFSVLQGAEVKNLKLNDVSIKGNVIVGGLAGRSIESHIEGVQISGNIQGNMKVGGISGLSDKSEYLNNSTNVAVIALGEDRDSLGGLVGESNKSTIIANAAEGIVSGYEAIGGLIGESNDNFIQQSYASGQVTGNYQVGGLIGQLNYESSHTIADNYVIGSVRSDATGNNDFSAEAIGGLIGEVNKVRRSSNTSQINVLNNYVAASVNVMSDNSSSPVDDQTIGSVIGNLNDPENQVIFTNNYYDLAKSSTNQQNGFNYATGLTTEQMKQQSNFSGWDFDGVWTTRNRINDGYPILRSSKLMTAPTPPLPDRTIDYLYPYPTNGTITQSTSKVIVKLNEAGRFYFDNRTYDEENAGQSDEDTKLHALANLSYVDLEANEERSFLFTGLEESTSYRVFLAVEDTNGQLWNMGERGYETPANSTPFPQNVVATPGDGQAAIEWTEEPELEYRVYMYQGTEAPKDPDLWTNVTDSYIDGHIGGLTNGESYVFAVRSYTSDEENSDYVASNVVIPQEENNNGGGSNPDPDPNFPVPQHVVATKGEKKVTLTWDPIMNGLASVYMYEGSSAPVDPSQWVLVTSNIMNSSWEINDLREGEKYIFAVRAVYEDGVSEYGISNSVKINITPSNPETPGNGGGGGVITPTPVSPTTPQAPQKEVIKVDVANGDQASTIASLEIKRTRGTDGTVKDELFLDQSKTQTIIDQLKQTGSRTAVVLIPDAKDEVSQWDLKLSPQSSAMLAEQGVNLVISNPNVKIIVPASSLNGRTDDMYFRLVPVKKESQRSEIQTRAQANESIIQFVGTTDIQIIGRPMMIETNLQSRPVTLILPLDANQVAGVKSEELGVYIEHSDGTKELVHGKRVTLNGDNQQGVEIEVNKFSTFSIVKVKDWTDNTLKAQPYIQGYTDGSFRPERNVTRAEMATLITRILGTSTLEGSHEFTDVTSSHWAQAAISAAAQSGSVQGYTDGSFKPDQAITRAEMAVVLQPLLTSAQMTTAPKAFTDVNEHWAQQAVEQLSSAGVVTGYKDGTFRPSRPITRAEAVTMLNKLIGLQAETNAAGQWSDVPVTHWAYEAIEAASIRK